LLKKCFRSGAESISCSHPQQLSQYVVSAQVDERVFQQPARAIRAIEGLSQSLILPEDTMRSELIFGAMTYVSNRFLLTRLASKATRSFHRPNTRIEDTANEVFERLAHANPLAGASYADNLQLCPYAAQGETHSLYEDLEQSVA
jgi:hypothetical protein